MLKKDIRNIDLQDKQGGIDIGPLSINFIGSKEEEQVASAHRHDHYLCFFMKAGYMKLSVNFQEVEVKDNTLLMIQPGQVHQPIACGDISGWVIAYDEKLADPHARILLEQSISNIALLTLTHRQALWFDTLLSLMHSTVKQYDTITLHHQLLQSLLNSFFLQFAGIFLQQEHQTYEQHSLRNIDVTKTFRYLVREHAREIKKPAEYALRMNVTVSYLNTAVRTVTGYPTTHLIQKEVVSEAQRLLFYTSESVKQIAWHLGYDDYKYFIRLFTKITGVSPLRFRKEKKWPEQVHNDNRNTDTENTKHIQTIIKTPTEGSFRKISITMKQVLISGAGIAGPTLAYWLHKYGFTVTVVERFASIRLGGQNIDLKGASRKIAQKMGIEQQVIAADTGEKGVQFVDSQSRVVGEFPKGSAGGLTSELEILRGDLVSILYNQTKANATYIFGESITSLHDDGNMVTVTLSGGRTNTFDLVIIGDGVRSRTRELVFGDAPKLKYLGLYTSYLTIPSEASDTQWAQWYTATKSRIITTRPDNKGTTRVGLAFLSPLKNYEKLPPAEQKKILSSLFEDAGWQTPRILRELQKSDDVYLDATSQVMAPTWSKGRVAMIGDAAYCPTPITGMGTSLAMIGAYVLAGELSRTDDHQAAFAEYEKKLRPFVEKTQRLPPGVP